VAHLPADSQVACCRLDRLFDTQLEFWGDLWSSLVLSRLERQAFREVSAAAGRQHEWLSGRTAAKDAVRELVRRQVGVDLLPADIQIRQDSYGRPFLDGHWLQDLAAVPQISLAHSKGTAVAVAAMLPEGARLGVDIELLRDLPDVVEATAFSPDEQDLYGGLSSSLQAEWRLRAWCAKEAVGKALGRGLLEGPASVKIVSLDPAEGLVEASISGKLLAEFPELANIELAVYTARDGDFVTALTFCERKA
jgi:phosphopantetheinyl transferase